MIEDKKTTFSIGDTANMTGVTQKQIRNWEEKKYIPEAERVVSGVRAYRRFNIEQVETMRLIKEYLDAGFTLKAAAQKATGATLSKMEVINNAK
jgi:MerR family redox-sensitive transcriptional activator SoxR